MATDVVTEAASEGRDTVRAGVSYTLGANLEDLVLTGTSAINGTGNTLANVITGNAAANTLDGGAGADTLAGAGGNDTYVVDNAADQVRENASEGLDTVRAGVTHTLALNIENLVLTGTAAINGTGNTLNNVITGNAAANTLTGGDGNDTLDGKQGADTLTGGAGADIFAFSTALAGNVDRIVDYNAAQDTVWLDNAVFTALNDGAMATTAFQAGSSSVAALASVRVIFNTSTGALLYDADGSGATGAVQFATIALSGLVGPVTAADLWVM